MSETLDAIVSQRIWLDYFDQNIKFDEAFTPQSCKILRRFVGTNGENDWYLVELGVPVKYEGAMYHHLMIRSRWVGCKVGDRQPTAVFIVLVPDVNKLTDPFKMEMSLYKAWGMAYQDTEASRKETSKRQHAGHIMQAIRIVLFNDWDPKGVNDSAPDTEYDLYIGGVYRLLSERVPNDELGEYLRRQEIDQMQMPTSPEHRAMVADKLLRIKVSDVE